MTVIWKCYTIQNLGKSNLNSSIYELPLKTEYKDGTKSRPQVEEVLYLFTSNQNFQNFDFFETFASHYQKMEGERRIK